METKLTFQSSFQQNYRPAYMSSRPPNPQTAITSTIISNPRQSNYNFVQPQTTVTTIIPNSRQSTPNYNFVQPQMRQNIQPVRMNRGCGCQGAI